LKIDVRVAVHAGNLPGAGGLPHGGVLVGGNAAVAGDPHVVIDGTQVNLVGQPVVVGVDHGIIAGVLDLAAEGVDNLTDLGGRQGAQGSIVLHVEGHGVGDGVILDQIQDEI